MAPRSVARGILEAGSGNGEDAATTAIKLVRRHPAAGSHLPTVDTASPAAVVPFASSPFAHPILQSRRRASGDLFSGSQGVR